MRVLVCGGRDYADYERVCKILDALHLDGTITDLCHGAAAGADSLAGRWAREHRVQVHEYPANWKELGRGAGPIRNKQMLVDFKPEFVVAFPGGRGTAHMVKIAQAAGVDTVVVPTYWIKDIDHDPWRYQK